MSQNTSAMSEVVAPSVSATAQHEGSEAVSPCLNGGQRKLVAEYVEVESGKRNSCPQLQAAMSHAKAVG